jgi:tellurite resistance protein TerC
MNTDTAVWIGFSAVVLTLLVLDLAIFNRRSHVLRFREAATWSAALVTLAMLFGLFVLAREGTQAALEFYTGYLIELSLSVDNLFVFIMIFQYFCVPAELQPRVLKWGIFGAMIMRGIMIVLGALLLQRFGWIVYVFGGLLIVTGVRMALQREEHELDLERNTVVRLARRLLPFGACYEGQRFFSRAAGRLVATPLLLVLIVVEWSDLVFAIDSIPAIFAVTSDPFIVYSSNVFAILGLRAMFFILAGMLDRFRYLKPGVALVLVFVGVKMTTSAWIHIPTLASLAVVLAILVLSVVASLVQGGRDARRDPEPAPSPTRRAAP